MRVIAWGSIATVYAAAAGIGLRFIGMGEHVAVFGAITVFALTLLVGGLCCVSGDEDEARGWK